MARQKAIDQKIQVTRGFVTEYTPAAFPQEAAIDVDNCIIDPDGSVRRRPGIDLEQQFRLNSVGGSTLTETEVNTQAMSQHLWEAVGNSGSLNIVVFQVGAVLQFFAQVGSLSANFLGEVNFSTFATDSTRIKTTKVEVASGLGDLYVSSKYMESIRIVFDGTTFTAEQIDVVFRDFEGLDDGLEIDERPFSLTPNHHYNLHNQGWTDVNINDFRSGAGVYPSNADIMTVGIITNADGDLEFDHRFITKGFLGNTPAPKGHFILGAFNRDYSEVSGIGGTGSLLIPTRPASVAFHQGRAWFASPSAIDVVGGVYYSQQLLTKDRVNACHQEADPTADEINDLVDTDGGFLPMPGVGEIISLQEFHTGVVVLASNGVWYISGADGGALTATSISLSKVSTVGAMGAGSIVVAGDVLYYWGIDGIVQLAPNEFGELKPTSITQQTIQTFYINISAVARSEAVGVYIPEQQKVFWTYKTAAAAETISEKSFDSLLVLDMTIKGFYKYSIGQSATQPFPIIVGLSLVRPLGESANSEIVTDNDGVIVTDNAGDPVTTDVTTSLGQITQLKLAVMAFSSLDAGYKTAFATFHSRTFTDWSDVHTTALGIPMVSFIEFAEFNMSALHTKGKITYVHSFYQHTSKNLEPGGYYELPPLQYASTGLRCTQAVIEVLNKPSANLRMTQACLEVLMTAPSDFRMTQSVIEVLSAS